MGSLRKAFEEAKPRLMVPGILCAVALGLLLLNGVLTRAAYAALRPVGGGFVAAYLPTLVLLAVSATGGYLGYQVPAPAPEQQDSSSQEKEKEKEKEPAPPDHADAVGKQAETTGAPADQAPATDAQSPAANAKPPAEQAAEPQR